MIATFSVPLGCWEQSEGRPQAVSQGAKAKGCRGSGLGMVASAPWHCCLQQGLALGTLSVLLELVPL